MQFKLRVGDLNGVDELIAANQAAIEKVCQDLQDSA
jgi:hypothetical protein